MIRPSLDKIIETMSLLDDWEDRYRYLLDLAKILPPMDPSLKTEAHFVKGCTSRVWMRAEVRNGKFHFVADSDAHLVRGLIGILYATYDGLTLQEVGAIDIKGAFEAMGLANNLTPNRRSGFFSMVEKIIQLSDQA